MTPRGTVPTNGRVLQEADLTCVSGQCQFFIWRKRRYCASRAAHDATRFCSDHAPTRLEQLRRKSLAGFGDGCESNEQPAMRPKRMTIPLSYGTETPAPPWAELFADPARPLLLDLSCARGRFLEALAAAWPDTYNYVGVEIYEPLVAAANACTPLPPGRLHYVAANISTSLASLALRGVRVACVQFPDPWHVKHGKRRLMSPAFVRQLAALLPVGGLLYVASDHRDIAEHARACALSTRAFELVTDEALAAAEVSNSAPQPPAAAAAAASDGAVGADEAAAAAGGSGWLARSPFPVPTERDRVAELKLRPVWRMLLRRRSAFEL